MVTPFANLNSWDRNVQGGNGLIHAVELTDEAGLYHHGRVFAHVTIVPGNSIGYHAHNHETEFYYILKGDAYFNDNGTEVPVHAGDVCATGYGQSHSLANRSDENVEVIALVIKE